MTVARPWRAPILIAVAVVAARPADQALGAERTVGRADHRGRLDAPVQPRLQQRHGLQQRSRLRAVHRGDRDAGDRLAARVAAQRWHQARCVRHGLPDRRRGRQPDRPACSAAMPGSTVRSSTSSTSQWFPIFNVADIAVNVGAAALILNSILVSRSDAAAIVGGPDRRQASTRSTTPGRSPRPARSTAPGRVTMIDEEVPAALDGERLDRIVALIGDVSRSDATLMIAAGGVSVDGAVAKSGKVRLVEGQQVSVDPDSRPDRPAPHRRPVGRVRHRARRRLGDRGRQAGRPRGAPGRRQSRRDARQRAARAVSRDRGRRRAASGPGSCIASTRGVPGCSSWPAPRMPPTC